MDAVNEASTVADDGLSVSTTSSAAFYEPRQEDEGVIVSILVPTSSSVHEKIPLPEMSGNTGTCKSALHNGIGKKLSLTHVAVFRLLDGRSTGTLQ